MKLPLSSITLEPLVQLGSAATPACIPERFIMSTIHQVSLAFGLATALVGTSALAAPSHTFNNGQCFYGQAVDASTAARTIELAPSGHLNAKAGEALRFVSDGRAFVWQFNGLDARAVDLQLIAPPGFDAKGATVHVGKDPQSRW